MVILDRLKLFAQVVPCADPCLISSAMRFTLIDRIVEIERGVSITAIKALTLSEEYLADHFPKFPVLPGVLMLEAMTQAGAWLVRASEDFAHSMVVMSQAANVKYGQFVKPGQTLTVTAQILGQTARETKFKASGKVDGHITVSGRFVLERFNLAETHPGRAHIDEVVKREMRALFKLLCQSPTGTLELPPQKLAATEAPVGRRRSGST